VPTLQIYPNLRIHYLEYNPSGFSTVMLLHGLGACGESWALQIPSLVDAGYRVIAPDIRGFGQSTYPGGKLRVSDLAADMARLLEHLHTGPAHLVGISMGGAIALQFALDFPALTQKLVLVNTFASLRPKNPSLWFYYALRFILVHTLGLPAQARAVSRRIFPRAEQDAYRQELVREICQADPSGYRAVMRSLALFNVANRLNEIYAPVLVISGEEDTTVPLRVQLDLMDSLPAARHILIPAAGHAVIIDQPEIFNQHLLEFLNNE
jgi:3-oxoadipate enol-lactonase